MPGSEQETVPSEQEEDYIPRQLRDHADRLTHGEKCDRITVRTLLSWFNAKRRGSQITDWIAQCLEEIGIVTVPDFRTVWIDGEIELRLASSRETPPRIGIGAEPEPSMAQEEVCPTPALTYDPTYRIGRLSTAQAVIGIAPDKPLAEAITLMMLRDYSQLPVWTNERTVKGIITWKSIASRVALGRDISIARLCMESHREADSDASLFEVIPIIVESGYVLIRGPDQRIVGIVTASDLSQQFRQLAEPFLLLGEIEQHIRKMIEGQVSTLDLRSACDPSDSHREIERASDLSLGELIRLLENPDVWAKLGLTLIDRKTMVDDLNRVRSIRNEVMHFDPDPVEDDAIRFLSAISRFLQRLDEIRSR